MKNLIDKIKFIDCNVKVCIDINKFAKINPIEENKDSLWDLYSFPAQNISKKQILYEIGNFYISMEKDEFMSRFSKEIIDDLNEQITKHVFKIQYLQNMYDYKDDSKFSRSDISYFLLKDLKKILHGKNFIIFQSWDTAYSDESKKSRSYSALTTWLVTNDQKIYLVDSIRFKALYPELKKKFIENYNKFLNSY